MIVPRQGAVGAGLALLLIVSWAAIEILALTIYPLEGAYLALAPLIVALLCWLNVGLFIIAHDAMHGSLVPGRPAVNRGFGRVALALYAGFSYDALLPRHMDHHRNPGSAEDPDFSPDHPRSFWPWYATFFTRYFRLTQFLILCAVVAALLIAGVRFEKLLLFWALPAILSSLQLFYFGTYLPHRHADAAFADEHNARSNGFSWLGSLLSCFHFGYHHEHHLAPHVPWWRLPAERRRRASPR